MRPTNIYGLTYKDFLACVLEGNLPVEDLSLTSTRIHLYHSLPVILREQFRTDRSMHCVRSAFLLTGKMMLHSRSKINTGVRRSSSSYLKGKNILFQIIILSLIILSLIILSLIILSLHLTAITIQTCSMYSHKLP